MDNSLIIIPQTFSPLDFFTPSRLDEWAHSGQTGTQMKNAYWGKYYLYTK